MPFPSHSFLPLQSEIFKATAPSGTSTCSSACSPQAAENTCPTMEHLLFLLTLVLPLSFPSLFLSLCSLLLFPSSLFSPFCNIFTEVPPGWLAQLCPAAGSLEPAMSGTDNPWPLLTEVTTTASLLPKPYHLGTVKLSNSSGSGIIFQYEGIYWNWVTKTKIVVQLEVLYS